VDLNRGRVPLNADDAPARQGFLVSSSKHPTGPRVGGVAFLDVSPLDGVGAG
jgi:hypothetical protein